MTQLNEKLIAVEVPEDAKEVRFRFGRYLTYRRLYSSHVEQFNEYPFKLLGFVTKDNISFDPEPYVNKQGDKYEDARLPFTFCLDTAKESFYSMIEMAELPLDNNKYLILVKQ